MRPPEYRVDFPTLYVAADWVSQHTVVPDGFDKGLPFELVDWQLWSLLNFYRVRLDAKPDQRARAFHYRRAQLVGPQKCGKAPYTSAHICVEAVGPALFAGWADGGETWDCRDHGCGCGWIYEYQPGEPMGQPWPTPLIQITAYSEDQTDNIYSALRPMIEYGPLRELIPKTGEEFIRLPGGGRIDTVTSDARSRLGARATYVPQDETGIWLAQNGMIKVAETQRRGLAGMGGRAEETTNAWDPSEDSVAQRTAESKSEDIFRWHPEAPQSLSYANKAERRKIHRHVYFGCHWIDLDVIEAEAAELLERDAPQAERFFGNRSVAGEGKAFNVEMFERKAILGQRPPKGTLIGIGVDGALFQDALAIIGTVIETGFQFVIGIWERPPNASRDYEHPLDEVDATMLEAVGERRGEGLYDVWRIYIDPGSQTGNIEPLVEKWLGRWGKERVIKWYMHRPRETGVAVHNYRRDVNKGQVPNDGDPIFTQHIKNAVKQKLPTKDENNPKLTLYRLAKEHPDSPNKIDAAAAGVLSWECRGDALSEDATHEPSSAVKYSDQRDKATEENEIKRPGLILRGDRYIDADRVREPVRGR